jgi:hydrogenase small subunit
LRPNLRAAPAIADVHVIWITAGLSCDGDTIAVTGATQPSLEDLLLGALPGLPRVHLHNPVLAVENGDDFMDVLHRAVVGGVENVVLVVEGSIPNEKLLTEGSWAALGVDKATGEPIPTTWWIERLAPNAAAVIAVGTCATYGGIPAMAGNPTGAMSLPDFLGWDWKSRAGVPIVCVPGCPVQPDNFTETLCYLLYQLAGHNPMIPLDAQLRPKWLFEQTVHEGCDRGGYYESADFATKYGQKQCIVKLGCYGPVVNCNVAKRGWMGGVGGCPNVGGICIGCTMPGFPDKFMPFMEEPPGAKMSSTAVVMYGRTVRALRQFTQQQLNREPAWRHARPELTSGYREEPSS